MKLNAYKKQTICRYIEYIMNRKQNWNKRNTDTIE